MLPVLKREPDNELVKKFVPMLFQLCVIADETADSSSSSEEEDSSDDDDDDDEEDSSDEDEGGDETAEPEPEPAPEPEPEAAAASAREARLAALGGVGVGADGKLQLPEMTAAELQAQGAADTARIRDALAGVLEEDGQPITRGGGGGGSDPAGGVE